MSEDFLIRHPDVHVVRVRRPVKNINSLTAPGYSCHQCESGKHDQCSGREYGLSWSFDCSCAKKVPHFEQVDVAQVPLTLLAELTKNTGLSPISDPIEKGDTAPSALDTDELLNVALAAVLEIHANEDISHLTGVLGSYNCPGCNHAGQGYCPTRLAIEATLGRLATTRKDPHDVG